MNAHAAIDPSGAPALTQTALTVPGMRCAGCIAKIERGLAAVDGIENARVNLTAKRVAIHHDPALDDLDLVESLRDLGFEAQAVAASPFAKDDGEDRRLFRALGVAGFGMMNIMLLSVSVWSGASGPTKDLFHWLSALIAIPVIAYAGRPFFASALGALRRGRTNMDVPISIGVLLATGLSIYETVVGGQHAYFDGAVMLLFFLLAGRALDAAMRDRTRAGIGALLSRMGRHASVLAPDGSTKRIEAEKLEPGMVMLVAAGEALAADGIIEDGEGAVDNAMLTGESAPEQVRVGQTIHAGAVNLLGPLRVRVTAAASDTVLAEIAGLMEEAGQSRSRYVRIADRASRAYAPVVHSLALLAFVGWMIAGAGWYQSLVIAIAVLIITCPCAMGLAVPAAQVVASGALIKRGVLVKDGSALERLAEVDVALFDKTGTLTRGEPQADLSGVPREHYPLILALAQTSRHPLSRSIVRALGEADVMPANVAEIDEVSGEGLRGMVDGVKIALARGSDDSATMATQFRIGDRSWTITFSDALRSDAQDALANLSGMGIQSSILSGDRAGPVETVARELGIEGKGGVSPQEKLAALESAKAAGQHPLMVGDGLNDGPALAAAHASIAPGTASDASQQAADVVFIGDKLMGVSDAVRVSRRTMKIVRQNFALSIGYNVLAIPLALGGMVTPLVAAVAMSLSSLIVVANSLRLARSAR